MDPTPALNNLAGAGPLGAVCVVCMLAVAAIAVAYHRAMRQSAERAETRLDQMTAAHTEALDNKRTEFLAAIKHEQDGCREERAETKAEFLAALREDRQALASFQADVKTELKEMSALLRSMRVVHS